MDAFAATTGPGLLGALLVGSNYAKALAIDQENPLSITIFRVIFLVCDEKKIDFPF